MLVCVYVSLQLHTEKHTQTCKSRVAAVSHRFQLVQVAQHVLQHLAGFVAVQHQQPLGIFDLCERGVSVRLGVCVCARILCAVCFTAASQEICTHTHVCGHL